VLKFWNESDRIGFVKDFVKSVDCHFAVDVPTVVLGEPGATLLLATSILVRIIGQ
jgi:hypothetical protein